MDIVFHKSRLKLTVMKKLSILEMQIIYSQFVIFTEMVNWRLTTSRVEQQIALLAL